MRHTEEIRQITRRLNKIEKDTNFMAGIVAKISAWIGRRHRRNAKSVSLTGPEVVAFRARMSAHGLDDDESRNENPGKCGARP